MDYEELAGKASEVTARFNALTTRLKELETALADNGSLQKHIVNYSKTRETYVQYRNSSVLTIDGNGSLAATGGTNGAGIGDGGNPLGEGGNITINGGTVEANGGSDGAGIGGSGNGGVRLNITINGGTVEANGGSNGAGIGGANYSLGGNITISGGRVTANGGNGSAGIGGGNGSSGGRIAISGGTVTATRGSSVECDIGPGQVIITGGSVHCTGETYKINSQPTNGVGAYPENVILTTLIVGSSANANTAITAGNIRGMACDETHNPATGVYGIKDVMTDASGIVYFYLPQTTNMNETITLWANGEPYTRAFRRYLFW